MSYDMGAFFLLHYIIKSYDKRLPSLANIVNMYCAVINKSIDKNIVELRKEFNTTFGKTLYEDKEINYSEESKAILYLLNVIDCMIFIFSITTRRM